MGNVLELKRFFESGRLEEEQRFKNFETIYHKIFYEDGTLSMHIEKKSNGKDISRFYDRFGTLTKVMKTKFVKLIISDWFNNTQQSNDIINR